MTRIRTLALLLVVGAVAALAAPSFLWPNYGQTPYWVAVSEADDDETGSVVAYEQLSPVEREAFDDGRRGEPLYSQRDADAISTFQRHDFVERDGVRYRAELEHGDGAWIFVTFLRWGLFLLGGALGATGVTLFVRDWRADGRASRS